MNRGCHVQVLLRAPRITPDVCARHVLKFPAVMDAGLRQCDVADERVGLIGGHMLFVAVMELALLDGVTGIVIAAAFIFLGQGRRAACKSIASANVQVCRMKPFCSS